MSLVTTFPFSTYTVFVVSAFKLVSKSCPNACKVTFSSYLQRLQTFSANPALSQVAGTNSKGSSSVVPKSCPKASISSDFVAPQSLHVNFIDPFSVQVAFVATIPSS